MPSNLQSIDDVIATLEGYIQENEKAGSPLGYFPALYLKVTKQVKKGIAEGFFEKGHRMEQLDVIFASRYIDAYDAYQRQEQVTRSWERAFLLAQDYWPIVLQHLLIGMNAHINLDLGIAAATVMEGEPIEDLHTDFNRINQILSQLVGEVQEELATIWPTLHWILRKTGQIDDKLVDFSMEIARDGAWRLAKELAGVPQDQWPQMIEERDQKVARYANAITDPGWLINLALKFIRLGERGTVAQKITILNTES
ncbi:MAG: DUF5995 family protein [Bacteroidota bacterium]